MDLDIGDNIYCHAEGWSGTVTDIHDDQYGCPAVAVLESHDPANFGPWICLPLSAYDERTVSRIN